MASYYTFIGIIEVAASNFVSSYTTTCPCKSYGKNVASITRDSTGLTYNFTDGTSELVYNASTSSWSIRSYRLLYFSVATAVWLDTSYGITHAPSFDKSTLVFDRTLDDVLLVKSFSARGYNSLTVAEKAKWDAGLKGAYNTADIERISTAESYLVPIAGVLGIEHSASVSNVRYRPWSSSLYDNFVTRCATYDTYVSLPSTVPAIPTKSFGLTFAGANAIEAHLYAIISLLEDQLYNETSLIKSFADGIVVLNEQGDGNKITYQNSEVILNE